MKSESINLQEFCQPIQSADSHIHNGCGDAKISLFNGTLSNQMKYVDRVVGVNMNSIQQYITSKAWSPSVFKENTLNGKRHRLINNFLSAEIFGVDIDDGCSIEQAVQIVKLCNLKALIGTTRNHLKEKVSGSGKKMPIRERFRIILFLKTPIYTDVQYREVFKQVKLIFPFCDDSCKDAARYYFPCQDIVFTNEGNKFELSAQEFLGHSGGLNGTVDKSVLQSPVTSALNLKNSPSLNKHKGSLFARTRDFIMHGAPEGKWHQELVPALFDLKEQGYSQEDAKIQVKKASLSANGDLDESDLHQIKDIYENRSVKNSRRERRENIAADQISDKVKFNLENIVQMSTVSEKSVSFIWSPYIAKGFVTLLTGDPGSGKSTLISHVISIISNGGLFWDGELSKQGNTVIFTAEDPLEEVLKPRLSKAKANTKNVFAFTLPLEFDEVGKQTILEAIKAYKPALLVIDPIVAYIGAGVDTSKANEVRAKMLFLSELAREYNLAILVIRHCAKGSGKENTPLIYRGHGSIDFVAAVRSEVMLVSDPKDKDGRYFGHTKSNLTKLGNTICFKMTADGPILVRIEQKSLSELCDSEFGDETVGTTVDEVAVLIREILSHGPIIRDDLYKELKGAGFTSATIRRGLDSIETIRPKRVNFLGKSRGVGAWVVCTDGQARALIEMKFEHLEQLSDWIAGWDVQHDQILSDKSPDTSNQNFYLLQNTKISSASKMEFE
ncbi:MAG: AAA family ATPase [Bdellovibrionaceae bacterium]|nr:AAA family ATPase [Pseudobdellovibrionaceae bacterium]